MTLARNEPMCRPYSSRYGLCLRGGFYEQISHENVSQSHMHCNSIHRNLVEFFAVMKRSAIDFTQIELSFYWTTYDRQNGNANSHEKVILLRFSLLEAVLY